MRKQHPVGRIRREAGQAIVILALASTVLVGFLALALDGSNAFAERRRAQNAADGGSMAGAYRIHQQNRALGSGVLTTAQQNTMRADVNRAAEAHGIADTDGIAGNEVNANLRIFYVDREGTVLCEAGNCVSLAVNAPWGVEAIVSNPFNTYFAGVIGRPVLTVSATAIALVHPGGPEYGDYAIMALYERPCGTENALHTTGSGGAIIGSVHSNESLNGGNNAPTIYGNLSFVNDPPNNWAYTGEEVERTPIENFVWPNADAFLAIVQAQIAAGNGTLINRNETVSNQTRYYGYASTTVPAVPRPYTFINGDFTVQPNANVGLHGLIFVQGDVDLSGVALGQPSTVTIVARGTIRLSNNAVFNSLPFQDGSTGLGSNGVALMSASAPNNPCNDVITLASSNNLVYGSIIAPSGRVHLSGSSTQIYGAIVGNTVKLSGSSQHVEWRSTYFPPQPDRLELLR